MSNRVNIGIDGIQRTQAEDLQISQNAAEALGTSAGKEFLRYLRSITIEMVNGPSVEGAHLMHQEGQRYIVGLIEQRIAHAHRSKSK